MKKEISLVIIVLGILVACTSTTSSKPAGRSNAPDHSSWTRILSEYVNKEGMVDYEGLTLKKADINTYAKLLSDNPPAENWSDKEEIAYWINAYNVFTVKLIVDNYPLESIKDLNPALSIPTVRSIWTKEWFKIGAEDFSLDRIEHKILRKKFEEPRIHFAVNCASISCPILRPEAFTAEILDAQLDEQARLFVNDKMRNEISADAIKLSKIFNWFGGDFKKGQTLIEFLNRYSEIQISDKASIRFLKYDWSLNDQKNKP